MPIDKNRKMMLHSITGNYKSLKIYMEEEQLLTRNHLAHLLSVDRITIWRWEHEGLPVVRISPALPRYKYSDVIKWLKKHGKEVKENAK